MLLEQHGIRISMSRTAAPYDNAQAESFIKTLKSVGGPVQCNLLDLIPQVHTVGARGTTSPKAVISGPAHARKLAQSIHACPRFARFLDLLVDVLAPLSASGRGRSLKRCKTFFKKSISIACWPILRSSLAMCSVSS